MKTFGFGCFYNFRFGHLRVLERLEAVFFRKTICMLREDQQRSYGKPLLEGQCVCVSGCLFLPFSFSIWF